MVSDQHDEDYFVFVEESAENQGAANQVVPWKILVADDDQDIHHVTRMVLRNFELEGRPLDILSAYSGQQALEMLKQNPDTALILLDVVMENEHAGLDVARQVRSVLHNPFVRIVLRTGQPGQAPETSVVIEYDINDYKEKTELTAQKLLTCLVSALRSYRDLQILESSRRSQAQAEQELHRTLNQLEDLVAQRTAQLEQAYANLELDIKQREATEAELLQKNAQLSGLNQQLQQAQEQLMQTEKMASIGQLAAGVAHEINNPIGYVFSNIGTLETYLQDVLRILDAYQQLEAAPGDARVQTELQTLKRELDLDYLREDIPLLLSQSQEGISRVRKIVQDLKDFSHVDNQKEWQWANLHKGLDSTLNMVANEIKYKADVVKEYGDLPEVECLPMQINQVFMNLLVNAAHAIDDNRRGTITIRTGREGENVWVDICDSGCGIPAEHMTRIFDPFFTTKPVGKGTGLGLSLSYGIIRAHQGEIRVESTPGQGTCFHISLPVNHNAAADEQA